MEQWTEHLREFVDTVEGLKKFVNVSPDEETAIKKTSTRWGTTPYFAILMNPDDPSCPIRKQVIPS
jgi:lysine 2,3-aminomutase